MKTILALELDNYIKRHKGRRQQMLLRLSSEYRVIYFDRMNNILPIIKNDLGNIHKYLKLRVHKLSDTFTFIELPAIFLPFFNMFRIINKINNIILSLFIRKIIKQFKIDAVEILWVGYPNGVDCSCRREITVYDCFDEHAGFGGWQNRKKILNNIELDLLKKADLTIFSSSLLYRKKAMYTKKNILIMNGADYSHFFINPQNSLQSEKTVLYAGVVSDWFDFETLEYCAVTLKNFKFIIVGPDRKNYSDRFKHYKNVSFTGQVDYKILPEYYRRAAVCIIPFKVNDLIKNTNPIKLYEYFAAGKPVVSSEYEEVLKYKNVAYIAKNKESFAELIEYAYNNNSIEQIIRRQKIAAQNTWESRIEDLKPVLNELLLNQ